MIAADEFEAAQSRLLERHGIDAESQFIEVPAVQGRVHVLRSGTGPPIVMVPGFADPAAMWAPLMAGLEGFTVYAVDRPCFGLTGKAEHTSAAFRRLAVDFLEQVIDALEIGRPLFVGNSIASAWSTWLALDRPGRVAALVHAGCPALWLDTSAPLPLRLLSVRPLGRFIMAISPPSPRHVETFGRKIGGEDLSRLPELRDLLVAAQKLPGAGLYPRPAPRRCAAARRSPGGEPLERATWTDSATRPADLGFPRCVRRADRGSGSCPAYSRQRALHCAGSRTCSLGRASRRGHCGRCPLLAKACCLMSVIAGMGSWLKLPVARGLSARWCRATYS